MEKRISFIEMQSVKSVAKAIDPYLRQKARLEAQLSGLDDEFKAKAAEALEKLKEKIKADMAAKQQKLNSEIEATEKQIAAVEAGIVSIVGFHVTDLVKKVIEPNEKGIKETKYLPTDIVSYDKETKQFIITVPDEEQPEPECPNHEEPTEKPQEEPEEAPAETEEASEHNEMPWE